MLSSGKVMVFFYHSRVTTLFLMPFSVAWYFLLCSRSLCHCFIGKLSEIKQGALSLIPHTDNFCGTNSVMIWFVSMLIQQQQQQQTVLAIFLRVRQQQKGKNTCEKNTIRSHTTLETVQKETAVASAFELIAHGINGSTSH